MRTTRRSGVAARVLVPAVAIGLLAACGGGGTSGSTGAAAGGAKLDLAGVSADQLKGTTIRFARFFGDCEDTTKGVTDVSKAKTECETIQILTNAFNAENKNGIKVERLGGAEWKSYYDSLNAAYAGGSAPDVAVMHGSSLTNYAKRGLLLKLDDHLAITKADINDAVPSAKVAVTHEGATYGLPFDVHGALVHLNVDLFKKAGLVDAQGVPKMPSSPEEFLAQAETISQKTGKKYFGTARVNDGLGVHMWRSLVQQQGKEVVSADGKTASIDTPESRTALDFMAKVFDGKYADPKQTYDSAQAAFLKGETAMLMNGTWVVDEYARTAPFTHRVADFPTLYGTPAIWGDSHLWVVPKQKTDDAKKYRAALEFASYLYENSGAWALKTGHIAARTSVLQSPEYQNAPQRANYSATGSTNAKQVPRVSNWQAVQDAMVKDIGAIWFQGTSVDEGLKNAQRDVSTILAK